VATYEEASNIWPALGADSDEPGYSNKVGGIDPIQSDACATIMQRLSALPPGVKRETASDGVTSNGAADAAAQTGGAAVTPLAAAMSMVGRCRYKSTQPIESS
jgi:hypothetical protein